MRIIAIDPGNVQSAYVLMEDYKPVEFGKVDNDQLRTLIIRHCDPLCASHVDCVVIEMIGHYGTGMPAGKTVFDTCVWIGRFDQVAGYASMILRPTVKAHLCGSARAKDGNVRQALIDRFGVVGTKKDPGWFYGFHADIWQAYAVGVTYMDRGNDACVTS